MALAVGAAVAFVGARGRRRGTTWIGLAVVAFGVLGLAGGLSDETAVVAVLVAAAGAGLVFAAPYMAALVGEPVDEAGATVEMLEAVDEPGMPVDPRPAPPEPTKDEQ